MRDNNSSLVNSLDKRQGKYRKINGQKRKVFNSFFAQPKTMLMVAIETGIERAGICRYVAALRKENRIHLVRKGICPITKHRAGFLTTNVKFLKPESHE